MRFVYRVTPEGRLYSSDSPIGDGDVAILVETTPTGEWGAWMPFGDCKRRYQDAIRTFVFWQECTLANPRGAIPPGEYRRGQIVTVQVPAHYSETTTPLPDHDYCGWCGADNGPAGEYRQNWDCHRCGSN